MQPVWRPPQGLIHISSGSQVTAAGNIRRAYRSPNHAASVALNGAAPAIKPVYYCESMNSLKFGMPVAALMTLAIMPSTAETRSNTTTNAPGVAGEFAALVRQLGEVKP